MEAKTRERSSWRERAYRARFAVVVIAFIPLILLSLLVYALYAVLLRVAVWTLWNTRGRNATNRSCDPSGARWIT
jgi:hypothetical protein